MAEVKRTCTIDGCERKHYGRGWCRLHWHRWHRHGDPNITHRIYGDLLGRLADKFLIGDDCWEWTAHRDRRGYGRFRYNGRVRAHVVLYELMVGSVPEGLELDHLCRNHGCVRPGHLEPVTHAENMRRGIGGWNMSIKTHCPAGHEYDEANTYHYENQRHCRACRTEQARASRARRALTE